MPQPIIVIPAQVKSHLQPLKERIFGIGVMPADDENNGMNGHKDVHDITELEFGINNGENSNTDQSGKYFQEPHAVTQWIDS